MLDRTIAPSAPSFQAFSIKRTESLTVANIPVHLLRSGDQPIVRMEFIFRAGTYFENKNGLSYLTSKMLSEGSKTYTSREIAEKIANYGAFLDIHHGVDLVNITFFLMEKHLQTLLPVMMEILTEATFPDEELANLKNITCQNLEVNKEKGQFLSSVEFRKALFGSEHPYGQQYWQENITAVSREELTLYFKQLFHLGNLEIFVAGQFDADKLLELLKRHISLPLASSRHVEVEDQYHFAAPTNVLIEKLSFVQSSIRVGRHTIGRSHSDFPQLAVLNEVLGGFFGSRLMKNIREDKGYTYGISSSIQAMQHATHMVIATDVKKETTLSTLQEIKHEMKLLQNELIEEEELQTVKSYMMGKFVNSINTPFALMDKFKTIHFGQLDYGYFDHYVTTVQAVSPEQLRDLAKGVFAEEDFYQVVVGGMN